jgi:hypothetical protein
MRKFIYAGCLLTTFLMAGMMRSSATLAVDGNNGCISLPYKLKGAFMKCGAIEVGPGRVEVTMGFGCIEGTQNFCESTCTGNCYIFKPDA